MSGKELMRLLDADGWVQGGRRNHGIFYSKQFLDEAYPRSTVIPDKMDDLPAGTLGAILSVKQTGLGRSGLQSLIDRYR